MCVCVCVWMWAAAARNRCSQLLWFLPLGFVQARSTREPTPLFPLATMSQPNDIYGGYQWALSQNHAPVVFLSSGFLFSPIFLGGQTLGSRFRVLLREAQCRQLEVEAPDCTVRTHLAGVPRRGVGGARKPCASKSLSGTQQAEKKGGPVP